MAKSPLSTLAGIPVYEQHPVALKLMPGGMSPEEFEAFCEDIEQRGLIFHITLYEGKVLDGWHRYRACCKTGTAIKTIEYSGTDPAGYVTACNVLRRKLSSLQRALVGARLHLEHAVSQRDVCKRLGISNSVLAMLLKVIDSRNAMILKRIEGDADYTRGMLREELADAGIIHSNYGSKAADEEPMEFVEHTNAPGAKPVNSVFAMGGADWVDEPAPEVGKRVNHSERRSKVTPAQALQSSFRDLMYDEKATFLQMVWNDLRPIAEELGLPGLAKTTTVNKVITKAKRGAKV